MKMEDNALFVRDLERDYPVAVRGRGVWIWDESGRKYLDGCAGANVSSIGHGVAEIADAMARQAKEIAYVPPQHFLNKPSLEFAERLLELAPKGYRRVMLLSGGSEAMENAFKIARQYHVYSGNPSKYKMVSRWQGFHGNTLAADAVGGSTSRRGISTPMLMDVPHIVPACCYRCAFGLCYPGCGVRCATDLDRTIVQEGSEYIAGFAAETVVGAAAAAVTPVAEYYPLIRETCDRHNVLWIADEVMAGVGRTGTFLAIEQWGVLPDLVVLAKGLSSGYVPFAAILVSDKVFAAFEKNRRPYVGGHTYNAHPVTASVGLAILDYLKQNRVLEAVPQKGHRLADGLRKIAETVPMVGNLRGRGLMWGLEFVKDRLSREPFDLSMKVSVRVMKAAMEKGLIVYPVQGGCADGHRGDGVLICPPLTISDAEIDVLVDTLREALLHVNRELGVSA